MYQGEEGRKAYEESCRKKCCGGHDKYGHAASVDNGDWDVTAPDTEGVKQHEIAHLTCRVGIEMTPEAEEVLNKIAAFNDRAVIRVTFREGNHVDFPCYGRTLRVAKHDDSYTIFEDKGDGKARIMNGDELAIFPCDVVQSIMRTPA